jgi:hypothetical protein
MNKMVIGGVSNQVFVANNLGRIEHFYSVLLGLPLVKRTVHHLDPRLPIITFGFQAFEGEPKRRHTISYVEWNPIFYMIVYYETEPGRRTQLTVSQSHFVPRLPYRAAVVVSLAVPLSLPIPPSAICG